MSGVFFFPPRDPGAGFAPGAFDFDFFLCLLRPQKPFNPPLRPFNPQFRPFTVNHLARRYPHAILSLLLSAAEKGAPPFVRYPSIFTTQHSRSVGPSILRVRRLPRPGRGVKSNLPF